MPKLIHEPIIVDINPMLRTVLRRGNMETFNVQPMEIADIQIIIKALSHQCQTYANKIRDLETKIKLQKNKLTELCAELKNLRKEEMR